MFTKIIFIINIIISKHIIFSSNDIFTYKNLYIMIKKYYRKYIRKNKII